MASIMGIVVVFDDGTQAQITGVKAKTFSTGSTGFNVFGKAESQDGERYQFSGNAVLIGSKPGSSKTRLMDVGKLTPAELRDMLKDAEEREGRTGSSKAARAAGNGR